MKILRNLILAGLLAGIVNAPLLGQCENWNNSPKKEDAENAHVNYRQYLKGKEVADLEKMEDENFKVAFSEWEKAYTLAPAADGTSREGCRFRRSRAMPHRRWPSRHRGGRFHGARPRLVAG